MLKAEPILTLPLLFENQFLIATAHRKDEVLAVRLVFEAGEAIEEINVPRTVWVGAVGSRRPVVGVVRVLQIRERIVSGAVGPP